MLPKGIRIGEADTNEVKKAYGNPKYEEQEPVTERYVFKYEMSGSATKSYVVFHFDDEGILAKVEFYNKREDYGTSIK